MLAGFTGFDRERIGPATRLFHDAGLSGDDYYELMVWYSHRFEVDLTGFQLSRFAPADGAFRWFGLRRYWVLTVGDLLELADCSSWAESGLAERLKRK